MSVLNSIRAGVSGLFAQSAKLGALANNISNSGTVGYKRADVQFESLVLAGSTGSSALAGVDSHLRMEISKVGQLQTTDVNTDIAVNGQGMFVVNENADGSGKTLVTRAGSFRPDADGNLINSAGYALQGIPLDASGNIIGNLGDNNVDSLQTVNIANIAVASAPTTTMTFWSNLPAAETAYASPPPDPINTSIEYYNALGATKTMNFEWSPTMPASAGDPPTNTWTLNVYDSASVTALNPTGLVGRATLTFDDTGPTAGKLASFVPAAGLGTYDPILGTFAVPTGDGSPLPINMGVVGGETGVTQLDGEYVPTKISKDGAPFGLLERVNVADNGDVIATFSNGRSRPIYRIPLAIFPNADGLNPVQGDAYEMTREAGNVRLLRPGEGAAGTTSGGALEASNVDISSELTSLIETQRAYSSNATVIRTADEMLDETNRLKR